MIITVTLNPAIDKTTKVEELQIGELNRLEKIIVDIAGKGISVARMVSVLGGNPITTGFIGEGNSRLILKTLDELKIKEDFVRVKGDIRTNLKVIDKNNRLTEINEPGLTVTEVEVANLLDKLAKMATSDTIFVLSGSVCQGVDKEIYAKMTRLIHKSGAKVFLDVDGEAFEAAIIEKPDFIKPNRYELLDYFKIKGDLAIYELKELCQQLIDKGIPSMALSMGADGGMFLEGNRCIYAKGLQVVCLSPVGAGDSMMAAVAYGKHQKLLWEEIARLAMAASAGAVITEGTKPPEKSIIDDLLGQVELQEI
jgi:1-phosphofructokinase